MELSQMTDEEYFKELMSIPRKDIGKKIAEEISGVQTMNMSKELFDLFDKGFVFALKEDSKEERNIRKSIYFKHSKYGKFNDE